MKVTKSPVAAACIRLPLVEGLIRFLAWTFVFVGLLIGAARMTAIRWWQIPADDQELGVSLAPTLQGGDWVLLWRFSKPVEGDLVVCPDPDDPTLQVIGRIVARAQDIVAIEGHQVLVNDKELPLEHPCTERTFKVIDPQTNEEVELRCDMEDVGGTLHKRAVATARGSQRRFTERVEPGEVFLLSDNRAMPFDSRHFGTVEHASCKEKIFFRLMGSDGYLDVDTRLTVIR